MARFRWRVKAGKHFGADDTVYIAGKAGQDIIDTDEDLGAKFKNKFERVVDEAPPRIVPAKALKAPDTDPVDVTDQFEDAVALGLKVWSHEGKYGITTAANVETILKDGGPLTKPQVTEFLDGYAAASGKVGQ